jgi:hypothetical protein
VAGPHGLLVFEEEDREGLFAAVVNGARVLEMFRAGPGPRDRLRKVGRTDPEYRRIVRRVHEGGGTG